MLPALATEGASLYYRAWHEARLMKNGSDYRVVGQSGFDTRLVFAVGLRAERSRQ